jgi:hypothetical protein
LNEDTFLKSIFFCFPFPIMMSWPPTLPTADNTPVVIIFVRSGRFLFASKYLAHNDNVGSLSLPSPPNAALWCPPTTPPEPFPSLLLAAAAASPLPDAAGLLARPRSRERTATGRAQEERQRAGDSILARQNLGVISFGRLCQMHATQGEQGARALPKNEQKFSAACLEKAGGGLRHAPLVPIATQRCGCWTLNHFGPGTSDVAKDRHVIVFGRRPCPSLHGPEACVVSSQRFCQCTVVKLKQDQGPH